MIFEGLAEKLQNTFSKLKGKGKLDEKDVNAAMREVKMALLEADVNFKVVKDFISRVKERAVGDEVLESLTPGQHVIKIVKDELTHLMGETQSKINFSNKPPTVIMMAGLQGAGKTTTCGKLAKLLKKEGKRPLLVAGDIYRPAAINQLEVVGKQVEVPVFSMGDKEKPVNIAKESILHAEKHGNDVVIIDTAGRLHIDANLMDELKEIDQGVNPHEKLLVLDSMTGQDAVNVAKEFNETIEINGVILTKLDGDTRGGAALSIRAVTDKPIKFVGMGEKLDELEAFHPDRMASRILGMGDMLSLIEKAESSFDQKKAREMEEKLRSQQFTFDDFLDQLEQIRNMGPIGDMLNMLPGVPSKQMKNLNVDEKELNHIQAIIQSMTKDERTNPGIINGSRRKRIAAGSGTSVQQVNKLIKQFEQTRKMMKQFSGSGMDKLKKKGGKMNMPFFG
ncbi:signal recognition particle protein [Isachenkonia alkalipeptolytica]|uniref:Signal recognition particle protein n=1 Tax=Isachenkonia alkalipeptolytica TaxID=2565777 RepID=A0AA43XMZ4_9CLOT|nr:signal recognition particle protein [Isachenkonia alkalipeptolytica]NBG89687.1 signal recognition particle protein [Isachenkonia alkalipeptolytica]